MWPTYNVWANASLFGAAGSALLIAAGLGALLDRSEQGRKALLTAPLVLAAVILSYIIIAVLFAPGKSTEKCVYTNEHPSDC